jgi:putative ABC transport system permease protein
MLRLHKLRSFLTMLGVIIGVMAVCLIIILVRGFESFIKAQFQDLAADGFYIIYDPTRLRDGESAGDLEGADEDVKAFLQTRVASIRNLSGIVECGNHTVRSGEKEAENVKVTATDVNNNTLMMKEILSGRLVNQRDVDTLASNVVISEKLAEQLFGKEEAVGKIIILPGLTVEVVGVMERPPQIGGPPSELVIEMPYTTAQRKWLGGRSYTYLMAQPIEGMTVDAAMDDVWQQLMVKTDNRPIFRVDSNASFLGIIGTIIGSIGVILAGIAALSLLVGGIGIMNIMLVSVKERTREIGLRKALGARKGAILAQFLIEAAVLSVLGGLIGMAIAYVMGLGISAFTVQAKWPNENGLSTTFPLVWAIAATGFSAAIGVIFGLFPAYSASNLDPIVALRYE